VFRASRTRYVAGGGAGHRGRAPPRTRAARLRGRGAPCPRGV